MAIPQPFAHSRGIRLLGTHSLPCVGCLNILLAMLLENIRLIPKWRPPRMVWAELTRKRGIEGQRQRQQKMASLANTLVYGPPFLTEDDIPGSSLNGRDPNRLKNSELKFWLKCRGDSCKGLSTKAQLCKR